jgi:hypothetical protein
LISGFFDPAFLDRPIPYVWVGVFLPGFSKEWRAVKFLLDTGAIGTLLQPKDALLTVGIPKAHLDNLHVWAQPDVAYGITGPATLYLHDVRYALYRDNGQVRFIDGKIRMAKLTPGNQQSPSLLGWDVLQHFHITADWPTRKIVLEDPASR